MFVRFAVWSGRSLTGGAGRTRSLFRFPQTASPGVSATVFEPPAGVAGLDDVAVMGDAIEERGGHLGIAEHGRPLAERQVGGDDYRGALVKLADEMEQQRPPERANGR